MDANGADERRQLADPEAGAVPRVPDEALTDFGVFEHRLRRLFRDVDARDLPLPSGTPARLGEFRLLRLLGEGGMARVYEAEQESLGRKVALKVLPAHLGLSARAVTKFHREARAGARQHHPGIVAVIAVGEDAGVHYIAQELVGDGHTVADELDRRRATGERPRGDLREVVGWVADVADALCHAHEHGVLHRDVKPSNILMADDGRPLLSDFGLASLEDALARSDGSGFLGTPYYVSPEQAAGRRRELDARSDVFSLGVTLYECLTLQRPFAGRDTQDVLRDITLREPLDPRRLEPRIPRDLAVICLKAMEKRPDARYPTMAAFADDLRRMLAGEAVSARPVGRLRRTGRWVRRRQLLSTAVAASLVAVVALAVLAGSMSRQDRVLRAAAEALYVPLRQALDWVSAESHGPPYRWCLAADPADPAGPMLRALEAIDGELLGEAAAALEQAAAGYATRDEARLADEARHLLARVRLRLADDPRQAPERGRLLEAARAGLERTADADPTSPLTLTWREPALLAGADVGALRVREDHELVRLYRGLALFDVLYKSGRRHEFEQALAHLQARVDARPDDALGLGFLGRVCFFVGRSYQRPDMLVRAERLLQRALAAHPEPAYQLVHTTLGQVDLELGRPRDALAHFDDAARTLGERDGAAHNVPSCKGQAWTRLGDYGRARAELERALVLQSGDAHTRIALAELHLAQGDLAAALAHAREAKTRSALMHSTKRDTHIAAADLVSARVHLQRGEPERAREHLDDLYDVAIYSPRELALGSLLILSFPAEQLAPDAQGQPSYLVRLADNLARYAASESDHDGQPVPLCLSAQAGADILAGRPEQALQALERAFALRAQTWPSEASDLRRSEDARDQQLMALAWLARQPSGAADVDPDAARALDEAERAWAALEPAPPPTSLTARLRARAHERAAALR